MATTSPDEIYSPDKANFWDLVVNLKAMADSIQTALSRRTGAGIAVRESDVSVSSGATMRLAPIGSGEATGVVTYSSNGFTVQRTGWYNVFARSEWQINSTGTRAIAIFVNSGETGVSAAVPALPGNSTNATASGVIRLNAGDVVTLRRWQTSGITLVETSARLSIAKVA